MSTTGTRWDDAPDTVPSIYPPKSCEQLGICQNPERECVGGCEMISPGVFESHDPAPATYDRLYIVVLLGISAGVVYGAGRWVWSNFGEQITAFFWAAISAAY